MRRVLITGENSYIGVNVEQYLRRYNEEHAEECYHVDTISQLDDSWKTYDFSSYDAVFDVTGIAHADIGKATEEEKALYYRVNCDLAVETATKAKAEGVRQFIYMSSIIVYGESASVGGKKHITEQTMPEPANFYGDSKWQAEKKLTPLGEEGFQVSIIRPPFIYGKGSKGNYPTLAKLARKLPVFPTLRNERSMLYIENLCEYVRLLIESGQGGVYFPQNAQYATTSELVRSIAKCHGRRIHGWSILNPCVRLASRMPGRIGKLANKAFGSLTYDMGMSETLGNYRIYDLEQSIERTESV